MPGAFHLYLPDLDAAYQRALEAGATPLSAPTVQPYGERFATVVDPQGNYWYLATRTHPLNRPTERGHYRSRLPQRIRNLNTKPRTTVTEHRRHEPRPEEAVSLAPFSLPISRSTR